MDETTFLAAADKALEALQDALEAEYDDLDCTRSGNVLTIELESGAQVVVNIQTPMREIWLASHFGGLHFEMRPEGWIDPKTGGTPLAAAESAVARLRG